MKTEEKRFSPVAWVPTLYFAMGLPFVALSMVSVLMFSDLNISNTQIAFWTSLIMLPWTLKPLWSPILEIFKTKKFFVVATELLTGLSFALIALSLPLPAFFTYANALMGVIALSGATHDIAADGVYMTELNTRQQAKFIGWQGAFYNLAKVLTNGGLVFLAGNLKDQFGPAKAWMVIMFICAALMALASLYHIRTLPSETKNAHTVTFRKSLQELWEVMRSFFQKKHIMWYILFIILYRFAEGFAMKIVSLFLKTPVTNGGLGLSVQNIGLVYGTFGAAAFIIGSIFGGYYIAGRGLQRSIFTLCYIFNFPFLVYFILSTY